MSQRDIDDVKDGFNKVKSGVVKAADAAIDGVDKVKDMVGKDDMKEEKVEMAFDSVDVPAQPVKKKKSKRSKSKKRAQVKSSRVASKKRTWLYHRVTRLFLRCAFTPSQHPFYYIFKIRIKNQIDCNRKYIILTRKL